MQRYLDKIHLMFPIVEGVDQSQLKTTVEGLYSVTRPEAANLIKDIISRYVGDDLSDLVITDGTANIGGSVINFAFDFAKVNAVEIDIATSEVLYHNISQYGLNNITVICDDYLNVMENLVQDVVFLDPPWGGTDYLKQDKMNLFLSGKSIGLVANSLIGRVKILAIKVPKNFDFTLFFNQVAFPIVHVHRVHNYYLIMCSSSK